MSVTVPFYDQINAQKREKRKTKKYWVGVQMFTIIIILSDTELFSLQQYFIFAIVYFI